MAADISREAKEHLHAIAARRDGDLTADEVVEDARSRHSPLHRYFEWDDKVAGHKYRLEQAAAIIRSIKFTVQTEERVIAAPYYVKDPTRDRGYTAISKLKTESDIAREALVREVNAAVDAMERARAVAVGLGLDDELSHLIEATQSLRSRIELVEEEG